MNIGVVTQIEAVKYINAPTLSTANTPPPPLKYIQSEVIHPPPSIWPYHQQCCQPSTHLNLML